MGTRLTMIFTKINKSMTLMFNWIATILAAVSLFALEYFPMLQNEIDMRLFVGGMILISVINKLLRAKTTAPLEEK